MKTNNLITHILENFGIGYGEPFYIVKRFETGNSEMLYTFEDKPTPFIVYDGTGLIRLTSVRDENFHIDRMLTIDNLEFVPCVMSPKEYEVAKHVSGNYGLVFDEVFLSVIKNEDETIRNKSLNFVRNIKMDDGSIESVIEYRLDVPNNSHTLMQSFITYKRWQLAL